MEFLLDLLKEERQRRLAAEEEVKMLKVAMGPLQQKELDKISKAREASFGSTRNQNTSQLRNADNKGRLVCDCGDCDGHVGYDEVDT